MNSSTRITSKKNGLATKSRVVAAAVATVVVSSAGLALAGTASATSLVNYPTFGCSKNVAGTGGRVYGDTLKVNLDGKTTTYGAELYRWNGATWADFGHLYTPSGTTVVGFVDTAFGELSEQTLAVNVTHGYYRVVYIMKSTGDAGTQSALAQELDYPASTRYDLNTCLV